MMTGWGTDWSSTAWDMAKILLAYLLALPIGWEREQQVHSLGLRTFPLVAMASCGYVLLAQPGPGGTAADTHSRIIQGLMTGIGFIGAGAILKSQENVRGTATAASIWNTGVIGAAVALGDYAVAVLLSVLNLVTLRLLARVKDRLDRGTPGPQ